MNTTNFIDAFSAVKGIFGDLTAEEQIEARYYNILGDISTALVEYRIQHGLNQNQLSEKLGVGQSMVSKYESGDYNISIRALNDLCGKLGFSLDVKITAPAEDRNEESPAVSDMNILLGDDCSSAA